MQVTEISQYDKLITMQKSDVELLVSILDIFAYNKPMTEKEEQYKKQVARLLCKILTDEPQALEQN